MKQGFDKQPAIQTVNLTRRFGKVTAVENLTLEVAAGEVFGFLGPNGAGKTTTVRMLTSLIAPTDGTARVNGFRVGEEDTQIRQSVGILTETPGLYQRLSAERNLQIYADLYDVDNAAAQIEKYLRLFGLWDRRVDEAGTFSKGMQQKLALARALLHEPQVVFLDEPTSGLDPAAARLVRESIQQMREEGRTIILCTHNLDEADRLCDRIGVFKTRMLVVDTPKNLRSQVFGRKIVIHLAAGEDRFASLVAEQPFVEEAVMLDNKLLITLENPEENNPQIVRLLVNAGANVQFIGELRRSLEEVYLELVQEA